MSEPIRHKSSAFDATVENLPREESLARDAGLGVLILNTHLPVFPGGGGVEHLTTKHVAALARRVGLVSMAHARADLDKVQGLADAGVQLYLWHSPHLDTPPPSSTNLSFVHAAHRHFRSLVDTLKAWPNRPVDTIIMDGCFRNMAGSLIAALSEGPWQVLAVIESSAAAMLDYTPRQLVSVLVMHDIRSVVYERRAAMSSSSFARWWLRRQARRYHAFERKYCQHYDVVTTVSKEDAAWVSRNYRPRRVVTVPLPIDAEYFAAPSAMKEVPGRIVFTGLMNHPPNADAALYFAHQVLPTIRLAVPDAEFYVVGRHPAAEVQALSQLPGVSVTGGVPDIRPFLAEATVVVVPLRYGSGARQKILEAWCMEKCVVSTTVGAEGLEYRDGVNVAIADGAETMARAVIRALRDSAYRDCLRHAGRTIAVEAHNPKAVAVDYYRQIEAVAAEKARQDVPMRIALDMGWMLPGVAGGLENLARSFMRELIGLDRYNSYAAILPARCRYDFDLRGHDNIRVVTRDSLAAYGDRILQRVLGVAHRRLHLDYWKSPEVAILRFARFLDAEIVYSFPGYIAPDVHPLRHVLMVPDIQHEFFPEFFADGVLEDRRQYYGDAIRRADHICAISEFTRQTLIERMGVTPEKITTIPLAADPIFSVAPHPDTDCLTLKQYGLPPRSYLFFPAHTWHHKNHRTAIEALRILRDKHGLTPALVCTGGAREAQPKIEEQIAASGLQAQVRFLGYCPLRDMPAIYRGAAALFFPSLFEGFGMPVLEAMASGCPVVCSNTTSLPEIAGNAALLVDPLDAEAFAGAIARVLREDDLRAELGERGSRHASKFSWRRHTIETIGVFYRLHRQLRAI